MAPRRWGWGQFDCDSAHGFRTMRHPLGVTFSTLRGYIRLYTYCNAVTCARSTTSDTKKCWHALPGGCDRICMCIRS
jgi:hypothetical protein